MERRQGRPGGSGGRSLHIILIGPANQNPPNPPDPNSRSWEPVPAPFVVAVDQQEKSPYLFLHPAQSPCSGIRVPADRLNRYYSITTRTIHLKTGDYSILGHEQQVAVERKSIEDLYSTLGGNRERFERELERLARMSFAAIVVEAGWNEILFDPPMHSALLPKSIHASVLSWNQRYPSVHWYPMPDRSIAEQTTFRILERWWKINVLPTIPKRSKRGASSCPGK